MKVRVRGKWVPVSPQRSKVHFAAGAEGRFERGEYYFWTAYGEDRYGPWAITGRARVRLSPADRFTRILREMKPRGFMYHGRRLKVNPEGRRVYRALWARLRTIQGIRAAHYREVSLWMVTHPADARFVDRPAEIRGQRIKRI